MIIHRNGEFSLDIWLSMQLLVEAQANTDEALDKSRRKS